MISDKEPGCSYEKCSGQSQANNLLKSCHYCYTFYCSKECRESDWPMHKLTKCYFGRLSSSCKRILSKVGRNFELRRELSKLARTGYDGGWSKIKKRGFVWLDFSSESEAEQFIAKPINQIKKLSNFLAFFGDDILPKYVFISPEITPNSLSQNDMVLSQLFSNYLTEDNKIEDKEISYFIDLVSSYDPLKEFILLASVRINKNDIQNELTPRKTAHCKSNLMYAFKFMKMNLKLEDDLSQKSSKLLNKDELPLTLILTSLNKSDNEMDNDNNNTEDNQENRELFLANLLNEFQMRGINLRTKFPKIYRDLCLYVEEERPFTPLCLFPRDVTKNNLFMCLIMPNSEPVNYPYWLNEHYESTITDESDDDLIINKLNLSKYLQIK